MDNYLELALNTEPTQEQYVEIVNRLGEPQIVRLLHSFMGLETEVGEILDALKKHIFYGKKLDVVNLSEEIGDVFWYEAIGIDALANLLDVDPYELEEEIRYKNIAKLAARYPDKFSEFSAINRDLETERNILENGTQKEENN